MFVRTVFRQFFFLLPSPKQRRSLYVQPGAGVLASARISPRGSSAGPVGQGGARQSSPNSVEHKARWRATPRSPHQQRLHPAAAAVRRAGGARRARSRRRRRRKVKDSAFQRPPTSQARTRSCCGPPAASSGYRRRSFFVHNHPQMCVQCVCVCVCVGIYVNMWVGPWSFEN